MNLHRRLFLILIAGMLVSGTAAHAAVSDDSWVGETVMAMKRMEQIRFVNIIGEKQVATSFSGLWSLPVLDDRDGRLRIHDGKNEGWVQKADFIRMREAV